MENTIKNLVSEVVKEQREKSKIHGIPKDEYLSICKNLFGAEKPEHIANITTGFNKCCKIVTRLVNGTDAAIIKAEMETKKAKKEE